ncbi:MAG TPA: metallophosphoesterase family protein [Nitrososphaera sp.]|nr:metallophosphoesterase family protein [Nitrososphaera sp.]
MQLAEQAKNANAIEFVQIIRQADYVLEGNIQNKRGVDRPTYNGLLEVCDLENLVIIGDLHGDSGSLFQILSDIDYEDFLSNPLNKLVFLGDYIDRGSDSISVVYSICYLKSEYPDSVILMRGNHEAPAEFPFSPHDFPYDLKEQYGKDWRKIYKEILSLFKKLTLASVIKHRLLLVHGGVPTQEGSASNFRQLIASGHINQASNSVVEEILWNDPRQIFEGKGYQRSSRGYGRYFGPKVTRSWLQATGTKAIIRGHEPCQGFKLDHDDTVMTLFSCSDIYDNSSAAYLQLNTTILDRIKDAKDLTFHVKFLG